MQLCLDCRASQTSDAIRVVVAVVVVVAAAAAVVVVPCARGSLLQHVLGAQAMQPCKKTQYLVRSRY